MDNQSGNVLVLLKCLIALVLVTGISATSVATIYDVDRAVGPGTITGTIETNGATGVLSTADIIDWNLTVDADGIQSTFGLLLGPISGNNSSITFLEGSALTATPTALFFDFSLPDFAIFQVATPGFDVVWQLQADAPIFSDELIREPPFPPANQSFVVHSQIQQLATAVAANVLDIDIKPGSDPNSINLKSKGKIPVVVLTTDTFDATQVDWRTVSFGPYGATEPHGRSHVKDVDNDGDMDVVLHFNTQDTGIACDDTEATLTGETFGGEAFTGSDAVSIVRCP